MFFRLEFDFFFLPLPKEKKQTFHTLLRCVFLALIISINNKIVVIT